MGAWDWTGMGEFCATGVCFEADWVGWLSGVKRTVSRAGVADADGGKGVCFDEAMGLECAHDLTG